MPLRVILVCTIILLIGVEGAYSMLAPLPGGSLHLNSTALLLPAGIMLALALPGARLVAHLAFGTCYLMLGAILVRTMMGKPVNLVLFGHEPPLPASLPLVLVFAMMLGSVLVLLHWMVQSDAFDEHLS